LTLKANISNGEYYLKVYDRNQEKELDYILFNVDFGISPDDF
jgi:hypothetical protein